MAVLRWSQEVRIEWHYIAPGKPTQNAFIESFNAACATNCSTRRYSSPSPKSEPCCTRGRTTTIMLGCSARWTISHRQNLPLAALQDRNGAERCATRWAPRPAPLLHRALWAQMYLGLSPLPDEPRGSDHHLCCTLSAMRSLRRFLRCNAPHSGQRSKGTGDRADSIVGIFRGSTQRFAMLRCRCATKNTATSNPIQSSADSRARHDGVTAFHRICGASAFSSPTDRMRSSAEIIPFVLR
jgi:hypothetical protein